MKVVTAPTSSKKETLEAIDALRKAIEDGDVVAFCAVGIYADDATHAWTGSVQRASRLRMMGALTHLTHCYINGEVG